MTLSKVWSDMSHKNRRPWQLCHTGWFQIFFVLLYYNWLRSLKKLYIAFFIMVMRFQNTVNEWKSRTILRDDEIGKEVNKVWLKNLIIICYMLITANSHEEANKPSSFRRKKKLRKLFETGNSSTDENKTWLFVHSFVCYLIYFNVLSLDSIRLSPLFIHFLFYVSLCWNYLLFDNWKFFNFAIFLSYAFCTLYMNFEVQIQGFSSIF